MDRFRFLQDISRKLDKGGQDTKRTRENVDIETGIVKIAFEQEASFFDKTEILAEREIRKCVIDKKKAEGGYRDPEQHLEKNLHRLLKGDDPCVLHTVV